MDITVTPGTGTIVAQGFAPDIHIESARQMLVTSDHFIGGLVGSLVDRGMDTVWHALSWVGSESADLYADYVRMITGS
jgi:hypothetical protein